ncbi:MAG: hypothetical protein V1836_04325 [Candidatus Aenigmatarchaeota archaeon]
MYANDTLLPNERIIGKYNSLMLTNKRIVGEENVADLALGGLGKMLSCLIGFRNSSHISGSVTEIRLDKIDSIKLTLIRKSLLLKLSNILWFATIFFLIVNWLVAPYRDTLQPLINLAGFIANIVTLGFLKNLLSLLGDALLSSGSYELPIVTFVASMVLFFIYILFKEIRLEIHSAKNFAFTNVLSFSVKGGVENAEKFAKSVREAEINYSKNPK